MADAKQAELERLGDLLQRPDFVLEPKCWNTIVQYMKAGGKPEKVVEYLATEYVGEAHMASLMCQWLTSFSDPSQQGTVAPDEVAEGPSPSSGRASGPSGKNKAPQYTDEAWFLKEFVKEKFSADKVADVFTARQGKPPPWLDHLTSEPRGRSLIYELSASYRNCLLLNFAIQKILQKGHEDEVAVVGASLASYFSVFHRLLGARLRSALGAMTPSELHTPATGTPVPTTAGAPASSPAPAPVVTLPTLSRELADSCSQAAHTYLHAQQLLRALGRHPRGAAFVRLSQELELASSQVHPAVWQTQRMLLPPGSGPTLTKAATLVGRILAQAPSVPHRDVLDLEALYKGVGSGGGAGGQELPLAPIQHAGLIKQLIQGVFTPLKPPTPALLSAAIELLALATAYPLDTTDSLVDADGTTQSPQLVQVLHTPLTAPDALISSHSSHWDHHGSLSHAAQERRQATKDALQGVVTLGSKLASGKVLLDDYALVKQAVGIPVAAAALLDTVSALLAVSGPDHKWEEQNILVAPDCLRMLLMVGSEQKQLLQQVVDLLRRCLMSIGSQQTMDVAHAFTACLVVVMRDMGAVTQVLAALDQWSQDADPSMVRHMILQVLSAISPPYSLTMVQWLVRHMTASGMRRKRETKDTVGSTELLRAFASSTLAMAGTGGMGAGGGVRTGAPRLVLGPKEQAMLQELASARAA